MVWQWVSDTSVSSSWVVWKHNLDFNTHNTLLEEDVPDSDVNEVLLWLTSTDHETILELHGLGSLLSEFTRDDDLASKGLVLHHSSDDGLGSKSDGDLLQKLIFKGLDLGGSAKTFSGDLGENDLDSVFLVTESLLEERGQFVELLTVVSSGGMGLGDSNNDFGLGWGNLDLNTGVTGGGEGSLEELVELGVENTVRDELSLL